jgi:hypothetical protein
MIEVSLLQLIQDVLLIGVGVSLAVIAYGLHQGYTEIKEKYFSTEAQLRRAARNWQHRSHEALEEFKNDVRRVTRRNPR